MEKRRVFIFLLIIILFFSLIISLFEARAVSPEEVENYLELPQKETEGLMNSLFGVLTSEWVNLISSGQSKPEEQAVIILVKKAVLARVLGRLSFQLSKATIKAAYKIALFANSTNIAVDLLKEFEKFTVEKAKEYALNWLFQDQTKVATGHLKAVYMSCFDKKQEVILPFIITYKKLTEREFQVGVAVYSAGEVEPPASSGNPNSVVLNDFWFEEEWLSRGRKNLPPFIFQVRGKVEKTSFGTYKWIGLPEIEFDFSSQVPQLDFYEPSIPEKINKDIQDKVEGVKKAIEGLKGFLDEAKESAKNGVDNFKSGFEDVKQEAVSFSEKIKAIVSQYRPLGAGIVAPEAPKSVETGTISISSIVENYKRTLSFLKGLDFSKDKAIQSSLNSSPEAATSQGTTEILNLLNSLQQQVNSAMERIKNLSIQEAATGLNPKEASLDDDEEEEEETEKKAEKQTIVFCSLAGIGAAKQNRVIINEIAWMGTKNSSNDEWFELKNISSQDVNLFGWQILDKDGQIKIAFEDETILSPDKFFLLERTDDNSVPFKTADLIYKGGLANSNEGLYLFNENCGLEDFVEAFDKWPAGDNSTKQTMERGAGLKWHTSAVVGGTPKAPNGLPFMSSLPENNNPPGNDTGDFPDEEEGPVQEDLSEEDPVQEPEPEPLLKGAVVINEIAWMGTGASANDEWLELYNPNVFEVDLKNWKLSAGDGSPEIILEGKIAGRGYYLLERTDDLTVSNIPADQIYTGALSNDGELLMLENSISALIDKVDCSDGWFAGDNQEKKTMERVNANADGSEASSWASYTGLIGNGLDAEENEIKGTPRSQNSVYVSEPPEAISDLRIDEQESSGNKAVLVWTAPEDPDSLPDRLSYEIRYSFDEINDNNWETAFSVNNGPMVETKGAFQSFALWPLNYQRKYYLAIKVFDGWHWSGLSNVVSFETSEPPEFIWPQTQQNSQKQGYLAVRGPENSDYSLVFSERVTNNVVVGAEGIIYFADNEGLYSFKPDLSQRWFSNEEQINSLLVVRDGSIIAVSRSKIISFDQLGNRLWEKSISYHYADLKPATFGRRFYVINGCPGFVDFSLFAFDSINGHLDWIFEAESGILYEEPTFECGPGGYYSGYYFSSPFIGKDGTIYFGDRINLYALDQAGVLKWRTDFAASQISAGSIGPDGIVYVITDRLLALNPENGEVFWSFGEIKSIFGPAFDKDGFLYFWGRTEGGIWLYKLDSQNPDIALWEIGPQFLGAFLSHLVIGQDGVFFADNYVGGTIIKALDLDGNELWRKEVQPGLFTRDLTVSDKGIIFVPGQKLYAIRP